MLSGTAPCCCIFPACSPVKRCSAFARRWNRQIGRTARSPPAINRPRPSTTCNCLKAIRWPRKSALPCWSGCGRTRASCPRRYRTRSSRRWSIATPKVAVSTFISTTPCASPRAASSGCAPICRPRCFSATPTSTTAANWKSRTPSAPNG
ncbi:hypothetical protein D3C78_1357670 [compost metagenome]